MQIAVFNEGNNVILTTYFTVKVGGTEKTIKVDFYAEMDNEVTALVYAEKLEKELSNFKIKIAQYAYNYLDEEDLTRLKRQMQLWNSKNKRWNFKFK